MTPTQEKQQILEAEKFLDQCPAWARKLGVDNMSLWKFCDRLIGKRWVDIDEQLAVLEAEQGDDREVRITRRVLIAWENMKDVKAEPQ